MVATQEAEVKLPRVMTDDQLREILSARGAEDGNDTLVDLLTEGKAKKGDLRRFVALAQEAVAVSQLGRITFKTGRSGTLSIYGLGTFPINIRPTALERLFEMRGEIEKEIKSGCVTYWPPVKGGGVYRGSGKKVKELPAVVVRLAKGRDDEYELASGDAAEKMAKELKIWREPDKKNSTGQSESTADE